MAHFELSYIPEGVLAPKANAFAERWVRSLCEECLDRLLIINERYLPRVVSGYVEYYYEARPHQGLEQQTPIPDQQHCKDGAIHCRDVLGGLLHDYYHQAA